MLPGVYLCLVLFVVPASMQPVTVIEPTMQECAKKGMSIVCDFKDTTEIEYELRDILPGQVSYKFTTISIVNVPILRITRNICSDLTLINVAKVRFLSVNGCPDKPYAITLNNSTAERLPRKIGRLTLTDASLDQLKCDLGIQRIFATRSFIGQLEASWPIGGTNYLRIDSSTIDHLIQISLQERVTLQIRNSTINRIAEEAIKIGDGCTLSVVGCTFGKVAAKAVVLKSGAKFSVQDTIGKLHTISSIPGKEDMEGRRAPGVPPKQPVAPEDEQVDPLDIEPEICPAPSFYLWLIPTILATIEGIAILVLLRNWKSSQRQKTAEPNYSETGYDNFNLQVDNQSQGYGYQPPTGYYQQTPRGSAHILRKR